MLDYSVPEYQFLIGTFDASDYLDSIALSLPMHEPGQALLWSGRFKVSNNLAAKMAGLTDDDFSEVATPNRWRPYQQKVHLNIRPRGGATFHKSPAFRIQNYRYNPQTNIGEGTLTQLPTAVAGERTSTSFPASISNGAYGYRIGEVIYKLLIAAFDSITGTINIEVDYNPFTVYPPVVVLYNSQISPTIELILDESRLYAPVFTRNPIADALKLLSLAWTWLIVDKDEKIKNIDGSTGQLVFSRTLDDVELTPDLSAIYQDAYAVIVTGARQVVDTDNTTNGVARPSFKATTEYRPNGLVFPSLSPQDIPIPFEEKTIIYQYSDNSTWAQHIPIGSDSLTRFASEIDGNKGTKPTDTTTPWQVITIKKQPRGYLFPSLGVDTTLIDAEVLVESNVRKLTLKPAGVLFPTLGTDATLQVEKNEKLTSSEIPPGTQLTPVAIDINGQQQRYETRPILEALQPVATTKLKTETFANQVRIAPMNWVPIFQKPLIVDFGFIPNYSRANFLAYKLAVREQQRRDQALVDMPIPSEWLAANWPPLSQCKIENDIWLMDGIAITISDREAKMGFTGALVSRGVTQMVNGIPTIVQQTQYHATTDDYPEIVTELIINDTIPTRNNLDLIVELIVSDTVFDGGSDGG